MTALEDFCATTRRAVVSNACSGEPREWILVEIPDFISAENSNSKAQAAKAERKWHRLQSVSFEKAAV